MSRYESSWSGLRQVYWHQILEFSPKKKQIIRIGVVLHGRIDHTRASELRTHRQVNRQPSSRALDQLVRLEVLADHRAHVPRGKGLAQKPH